ncbi:MAG: NUDIX domain-containing protein [Eubacterium sp.]|jgi:8-oxo-dGTP pyrophosphatase MutT (NUDIX family)|nr:NUDIX domain-containing protein [Eubacterium sp.]
MQHLNCSVVFNKQKDQVLFCKRAKEPFRGLYNFVGGKVEPGELSFNAAYRELLEETGIGRDQICLYRLMDLTYYEQDYVLEIYVGQLQNEVVQLREEVNPLKWLPLTEDFADSGRFAGEQNIAHIIRVALKFPL